MVAGLLLIAGSAVVLSLAGTGTSVWLLRAIMFVMGFGVAAVFLPSQAAGFATVGAERTSVAATIFNAQRMIGGAIGVALLTASSPPFTRCARWRAWQRPTCRLSATDCWSAPGWRSRQR
jgi:hypothetical protein